MESGENPELSRNCIEKFSESGLFLSIKMLSRSKLKTSFREHGLLEYNYAKL